MDARRDISAGALADRVTVVSRAQPQYVRAGRARAAIAIIVVFNFIGVWKVQQLAARNTTVIHRVAAVTDRVAADEGQLRTIGNSAVIDGCQRLNALKARVATAIEQTSRRTITAQTLLVHSAQTTPLQRAAALRLLQSAYSTLALTDSIFAQESCKGPF